MPEPEELRVYNTEEADAKIAEMIEARLMTLFGGGTEEQLLAKLSSGPLDFTWVNVTGGFVNEVRHDNTGTYDYMGTAPLDTAEDAEEWTITRTTMVSPPVSTTAFGKWTDRAILVYS